MKRSGFAPRTCAISPGTAKLSVKPRTCQNKACKDKFIPQRMGQKACCPGCAIIVGRDKLKADNDKAAKAERQSDKARKEALKSRSKWLAEAQAEFNAFIRARDAHLPCISCGRSNEVKVNAGHYLSIGAHPELRFDEDNCHKQCEHCNTYKSGNQANYRPRLVERIGAERVALLEGPHEPAKYTIDDAKGIKATYKSKLKELQGAKC